MKLMAFQFAVAIGTVVGLCGISRAQPSAEEIEQWAESQLASSRNYELGLAPNVVYEFQKRWLPGEDLTELDQLRAEAQGKPDHPNWQRIQYLEESAINGGMLEYLTILVTEDGEFRFGNRPAAGGQIAFTDIGYNKNAGWAMTSSQLSVVNNPNDPPEQRDYRSYQSEVRQIARLMLWGGFIDNKRSQLTVSTISPARQTETWDISIENADGTIAAVVSVSWNKEADRVFAKAIRAGLDDQPSVAFDSWKYDEASEMWVATSAVVDRFSAYPYSIRFVGAHRVSSSEAEEIVRTPDVAAEDPWRDLSTISSVATFGDDRLVMQKLDDLQQVVEESVTDDSRSNRVRMYGWVAAGAIAMILVGLRLRRRMQH